VPAAAAAVDQLSTVIVKPDVDRDVTAKFRRPDSQLTKMRGVVVNRPAGKVIVTVVFACTSTWIGIVPDPSASRLVDHVPPEV
jgi:hypothetical protein